ncbi:basal-body rod modification protein FlgD [Moorella thermoacetica]|uniref:Basal-body rod modification protein FlgD n=2 Tax=Neomoorella thermoacetica TaxID=1525 RepID=A0A1J5JM74_NEOTH|nr:flagellar hook capping FlgD N-terminal domain-containing protein [Moorella thermoacetica]APC07897.1 basal-body rod modification protein FlgD [Moorella thermoacetica]OIQ09820.1 basal-body rod modification protein FlgD [Moorella thermoacetica]
MNVTGVTAATTGTTSTVPNKGLGKDDFLKLLAAQLQNQDPLNPVSNTDFIAQMAQFSVLEQMNNLYESFNEALMLQAVGLIGKEVTARINDQTLTGTVSKVNLSPEGIILTVGEQQVSLKDVQEVALPANASPTPAAAG